MSLIPEQLTQHQKRHQEAAAALARVGVDSFERSVALGIEYSRQLIDEQAGIASQSLSSLTPQALAGAPLQFAAPWFERQVGFARRAYEISAEAGETAGKIIEAHYADNRRVFGDLLDELSRRAPAGSEAALAALRSTVDAVDHAVGRFNQTARHVAEATEANVTASSQAALKAVGARAAAANAPARKKVA